MTGVAPEAAPDPLLGGRYRLLREVAHRPATTLWQGVDEVLARPVAVKVLDDPAKPAQAFLDAAVAAGRLTHPRIASTYDAATEDGRTYVVSEWVEGTALVTLLRDGPLPAPRATTIAAQVAETVAYAHSRGVYHLDLDAHNVLIAGTGGVKVTDFELGAIVAGSERDDTKALGALLYACLTGRSAYGAEPELPLAPVRDGKLLAPRQVRATVPRELDAVVIRTLRPDLLRHATPITAPDELLAALAPLPGEGGATTPAEDAAEPRPPSRWVRLGVPLLAVAGVGVAGMLAGLAIGRVPGTVEKFPGLGTAPSGSPGSAAPGQPVRPVSIRDFDPQGDGHENAAQVPLATDGDVNTAWSTTTYFRTPAFGGLKAGAGLLVDFGTAVPIRQVRIAFAKPGVSLELRAADTAATDIGGYPVVASVTDAKAETTLRPRSGTTARYWVLWFTGLVPTDNGKFSAGIAEFACYR